MNTQGTSIPSVDTIDNSNPNNNPTDSVTALKTLINEFSQTKFNIELLKQKHIEKYSDPSAITDDADDRTETFRENVREILLTNPKLVETEWKHHKQILSQKQFTYIEQETQERFLERLTDVVLEPIKNEQVKEIEDDIAAIKQSWKAKKAELATLKKEFEDLAEPTCEQYAMVQNIYAEAQSVVAEIEDGHAELERLVALNINNQKTLNEAQNAVDLNTAKVEEVEHTMRDLKNKLTDLESTNELLKDELITLRSQYSDLREAVEEETQKANDRDPLIDGLTKWYNDAGAALYKLLGIESIKSTSSRTIEIIYDLPEQKKITVRLTLDGVAGPTIQAKLLDANYPIDDLVSVFNKTYRRIDQLIGSLVTAIHQRISLYAARETEWNNIKDLYNLQYQSGGDSVTATLPSGKAVTFKVHRDYGKVSGCFNVVGNNDLQEKLNQSKSRTLTDFLSLCT